MSSSSESMNDIKIENINQTWIEKNSDLNQLQKAYKFLKRQEKFDPELYSLIRQRIIEVQDEQNKNQNSSTSQQDEDQVQKDDFYNNQQRALDQKNMGNDALKTNVIYQLKDLQLAINYYTKSIDFDPKLTASYYNRALVYLKLKNFEKCIQDCNIAIKLDPNYYKAYQRRVNAYLEIEQYDRVKKDLEFLIKNDFDKADNQKLLENIDMIQNFNQQQQKKEQNQKSESQVESQKQENKEQQQNKQENIDTAKEESQMIELLKEIKLIREEALGKFKYQNWNECTHLYKNIIKKLMSPKFKTEDIKIHVLKQICQTHQNLSICYLKTKEYDNALQSLECIFQNDSIMKKSLIIDSLMRRAQIYELIGQQEKAIADYQQIRQLDHLNTQAANCLFKINPQLIKQNQSQTSNIQSSMRIEEVNSEEDDEQVTLQIETIKKEGNEFFKSKNYDLAIQKFTEGLQLAIQKKFKDSQKSPQEKKNLLFINLLSNRSLCFINLEKYENCIQDCNQILEIDSNHQKALYRRCQGLIKLEKLEESQQDIETLLKIDQKLDISKLTSDLNEMKKILKLKEIEKKKNEKSNIDREFIDKVSRSMSVQAVDMILQSEKVAANVSQFEKDCKVFQKNPDYFFDYLKKIQHNIQIIFKNQEISPDHLMFIIKTLNKDGSQNHSQFCLDILSDLSKTTKFLFVIKLLSKKEKQAFKDLIEILNQKIQDSKEIQDLLQILEK